MRVPIPLVLFLAFAVVTGAWWHGTRNSDFLTPPSEVKLAEIRVKVEASLPQADHPGDAISAPAATTAPVPPPPPVEEPKPTIDLGDLSKPPTLQEYGDVASQGAAKLVELAVLLETKGEFQRALLAWERVIDMGKADETQTLAAIAAIKRLRPTLPDWNTDAATAIPIVLHAGTGKKTAKILESVLQQTARDIEHASAGILKITAKVNASKRELAAKGPAPIALWMMGPAKDSGSTEVLSFTVGSPESLHVELQKTVFLLIRGYLARVTTHMPPPALKDGGNPLEALGCNVTRLSWKDLGTALNLHQKKGE